MINIEELVAKLDLERSRTFCSFSSLDKDIALMLINRLKEMKINYWAMYTDSGKDTNIGGENYERIIHEQLSHACLLIVLVSKNSLASVEVKKEIDFVKNEKTNDCTHPTVKIYPIIIDDTDEKDIPTDYFDSDEVDVTKIIMRRFNLNSKDKVLDVICEEIKEQYVRSIVDNAAQKIQLIRNSNKFIDLLNLCIKQDCDTNLVSEDIKNTTEIEHSGENEVHVLSNEMRNYDYNTYSLMIIASNLLGDPIKTKNVFEFRPSREGSKYFYYVTKEYKPEADIVLAEIKRFIKKDKDSRLKVTSLIRHDFCERTKLQTFFQNNFADKKIEEILDIYGVDTSVDNLIKEKIENIFETDPASGYFTIKNNGGRISEVFSIPVDFLTWLNGEKPISSVESRNTVVNNFIEFLRQFRDSLENVGEPDINTQLFDMLKYHVKNLEYLQKLEIWQNGSYMKPSESKKIVNLLLNETDSNVDYIKKDYLHLESWMNFSYDEDGNAIEIPDEVVDKAFENCHLIIVDDFNNDNKKLLKLCYSFALFITKEGLTGAWYTTGKSTTLINDSNTYLVTTYEIKSPKDPGYNELKEAFRYLIDVNPQAKQELIKAKSKIFNYFIN